MSTEPIHANTWYDHLPVEQVRREIQNLYATVAGGGGGGDVTWASLVGKPSEFPPSAHTHVRADITDFAHTHLMADITDMGSYLPLTGGTLTGDLTFSREHPHINLRNTHASYLGKNFDIANYQGSLMFTKVDGTTWQANIAKFDWTSLEFEVYNSLKVGGNAEVSGTVRGQTVGTWNTDNTTGRGISLYGGPYSGYAPYSIMFAGTATFGSHGSVTDAWATYLTTSATTTRGWIFKAGTGTGGNVASISGGGNLVINGNLYVPNVIEHVGDTNTYMQFHAEDQWRVVTGGSERIEANNTDGIYMWGARVSGKLVIPVK